MTGPGRKPPRDVLLQLRQEVGFCCPVADCGNPYLTWHHFDPPWRVEHHHRPEGMVALCRVHADQADNGAFTDDQIRELKALGRERAELVQGRFNWLRQDLLAVVGGNFYYKQDHILQIGSMDCIWFSRDERNNMLLNFRLPTLSGRPRAAIEDNVWTVLPEVNEVICPPGGRLVEVNYSNGDRFKAEFISVDSAGDLLKRYAGRGVEHWIGQVSFPITVVEIWETAAGTALDFTPTATKLPGATFIDGFMSGAGVAIHITVSDEQLKQLFPDLD
jgi:hypothetical protein